MRFQQTKSSCGPASLANAARAMGIERTEDELIELCHTTPDGTTPRNLVKAANLISSGAFEVRERRPEVAIAFLRDSCRAGRAGVALVDEGEHYVAIVGRLGQRFVVVDPAHNDMVLCYNLDDWLARWRYPGPGSSIHYWAVIL